MSHIVSFAIACILGLMTFRNMWPSTQLVKVRQYNEYEAPIT